MKKLLLIVACLAVILTACGPSTPPSPVATTPPVQPPATETIAPSPLPSDTAAPTITSTPSYPTEGLGPASFPAGVDPLTSLKVSNPALLDRRPMLIKVQNLPRSSRPQWGLSLADLVFEYYTEEGGTRFSAVFYGNDADTVGPIRSGRFIDDYLMQGYKAVFAFGYAYVAEMQRFVHSNYANRLVVEGPGAPFKRYDPNGNNYLTISTANLTTYAKNKGVDTGGQDLTGMFFKLEPPAGGQPAAQAYVRYSGSIYNRWDYDAASGRYLRFSDTRDVFVAGDSENYAQLTDRLTNQPIAFDNLAVLYVNHSVYSPGIYDILLTGTGTAYAFRDGQMYQVQWKRDSTGVVTLLNPDGTPYAFKPGPTWFEVIGLNSTLAQDGQIFRFKHVMP
jgi:hypothetical protein